MPGISWTAMTLRFDGTLETKQDVRVSSPPDFDLLRDAQFEEISALQTRPPFGAVLGAGAIFGGGTLANCRRLAVVNGELVLFTDTGLYSWAPEVSAWVLRATHLAAAITEQPQFATNGDQIDGDRAELNGTVIFAWTEGTQVYAAALDKVTESVLVSPTAVSTAVGRPRLLALATKIMLFTDAGSNNLTMRAIDPATPGTAIGGAGTTVLATNFNSYYDVARVVATDTAIVACRRTTTTSYSLIKITASLTTASATPARTCDGPIAISVDPTGTNAQIVRANNTNIQGDLVNATTFADVFTGQAIGTATGLPVNQIAACHRSVQNAGAYRCYVFWSAEETAGSSDWESRSNWIDTANAHGTAARFIGQLGIASRAFDYNGSVYVWLAFGGASTFAGAGATGFQSFASQNTYFLYRDDASLVAKTIGGHGGGLVPSTGRLPSVQALGGAAYVWCGTQRRRLDLGGGASRRGFAAREPVSVTIAFDTNAARRSAQLGQTLYVAAGEILQYDGTRLVEVGFHVYPWNFGVIDAGSVGGSIAAGKYAYKITWRYNNGVGETDRSTTATIGTVTIAGNAAQIPFGFGPLTVTHKTASPPAVEVWRTEVAPEDEAPFFLASSNDPTALTNPNRYVPNDTTATSLPVFNDFLADSTLTTHETNPENEGILENIVPPAATIVVPTETRLILAGVAGDPDAWWYSRERGDGEIASFHDELRVEVPPVGGAITALWVDDQFVYVSRATAIYAYAGPGLDNAGNGQNYTLVRTISRDVGVVSQEAHAPTPVGRLIKTSKGWYLIDGGGVPRYVGGPVADFDSDTVLAVHTITAKHQVRILTSGRLLVWDYRGLIATTNQDPGRWNEWTIADGLDAVLWNGSYVYLTAAGPKVEQASYTGLTYGLDAALAWIKPADLFGAVALRKIQPLGEYRSAHLLRMRIAYNYNETIVDDVVWSPSPTTVGGPLQMSHGPKRRNCQAFKVRLTAVTETSRASFVTSGLAPQVATSGTAWSSSWSAAALNGQTLYGELGNQVKIAMTFEAGANLVDVRDNFTYDAATGLWSPTSGTVGIRVACQVGTLTVAALESAIAAASTLIVLVNPDATPTKTINAAGMAGLAPAGQFAGGVFGSPTGEALKLTGLGLEVGISHPGLYRRLAPAQKT